MMKTMLIDREPQLPPRVITALHMVRRAGWRDMCQREGALVLAGLLGFEQEARWLAEHRHLYFEALREAGLLDNRAKVAV